jgi:hypothetical protein
MMPFSASTIGRTRKRKNVLSKRFAKYGLTLHPETTRLVEFGRYAEERAKKQGKKPNSFDFLGRTFARAAEEGSSPCK